MTYAVMLKDAALTVAPLALAAATGLLGKGAQYALHAVGAIKNKTIRDGLDWAITHAESLAKSAVVAANETTVNALKSAGQFSATEASKVFQSVLATVTANLGANAKAILEKELPDLPSFLGTLIESQVAVAANRTHAAAASSTPSA